MFDCPAAIHTSPTTTLLYIRLYITPSIECVEIAAENSIMAASGTPGENQITISEDEYGIGDTQLSKPSSYSIWDD